MSDIVEQQTTFFHSLIDCFRCVRIGGTCRRGVLFVGIGVNLLHVQIGVGCFYFIVYVFCVLDEVSLSPRIGIVCRQSYCISPISPISGFDVGFAYIPFAFVHHVLCFCGCVYCKSSHSYAHCIPYVSACVWRKVGENVVRRERRACVYQRAFRLVGGNEIVVVFKDILVVESAIAEKKQILRCRTCLYIFII